VKRSMKRLVLVFCALAALSSVPAAGQDETKGFDPTGTWMGMHGPLALMSDGETLSFSYSAAYGALEISCDGIGLAKRVGDGRWEYVDEKGAVTFTARGGRVRIEATRGQASFCGPKWPGETFAMDSFKPPFPCTVTEAKATFGAVGPLPPTARKAYVLKGDPVEAVGLVNESSAAWLFARFRGKTRTTSGLLERDALECKED